MKCLCCGHKMRPFLSGVIDDRYGSPGVYSISRCPHCGFGRTLPSLRRNDIARLYKEYYPLAETTSSLVKQSAGIGNSIKNWLEGTDNIAHRYITKGSEVLDIGSGSGVSLLEIEKLGGTAYGVEPDPNAQTIAKKLNLKVFRGFLSDNPFPNKRFDFIAASQVIEHEPDPAEFLRLAERKLKPDGKIILSFPNLNAFYRYVFGKRWIHWHVPYHINHFTEDAIKILIRKSRLKIDKIRTITPNLWTLLQLRMLKIENKEYASAGVWRPVSRRRDNDFLNAIKRLTPFVAAPPNRLLDLLGVGESILVFLKKK